MAGPETQIRSDDASGIARILGDVGSAVRGFYDRGGLAGVLGMEPWHKKPPLDIAMMFAGGTGLGQLPPQLARKMLADTLRASRAKQKRQVGPTIYHGSPHKFDWPEAGHELTGEGAAAYGRGIIYGAEAPGVGKSYRSAGVGSFGYGGGYTVKGRLLPRNPTGSWAAELSGSIDHYLKELKANPDGGLTAHLRDWEIPNIIKMWHSKSGQQTGLGADDMRNWIDVWENHVKPAKASDIGHVGPGHLYEMTLSRQGEEFLDWDKPLSEQSESVRKAIRGLTNDTKNPNYIPMPIPNDAPGYNVYQSIIDMAGSDEAASNVLREAGIPGIRYLDQMSRGAQRVVTVDGEPVRLTNAAVSTAAYRVEQHGSVEAALEHYRKSRDDPHNAVPILEDWLSRDVELGGPEPTRNYVLFDASSVRSVKRD